MMFFKRHHPPGVRVRRTVAVIAQDEQRFGRDRPGTFIIGRGADIGLIHRLIVDVNGPVGDAHRIARQTDDALDVRLAVGIGRIFEDDNIPPPRRVEQIGDLVDDDEIPGIQGGLHADRFDADARRNGIDAQK